MNWYIGCWQKYADFSGRARRREYWMFYLFNCLAGIAVGIVDAVLVGTGGLLGGLYNLAVLVPSLAVMARRLHDTNRSGWMMLIMLIPLIGVIVLLVFMCQDSKPGDNRFGANPKSVA